MRFTEFSIPDTSIWMEKSDILFLIDCCNRETPFVSRAIVEDSELFMQDPYNIILDKIHPEDLQDFVKVINGRSSRPAHQKLRIFDRTNHTRLFSFHKLKIGAGSKNREMLLGISKKTIKEPVTMTVPVNW